MQKWKSTIILIAILLFYQIILNSCQSDNVQIKQFHEIVNQVKENNSSLLNFNSKANSTTIEFDSLYIFLAAFYDIKESPAKSSIDKKGEFETTVQYNKRLEAYNDSVKQWRKDAMCSFIPNIEAGINFVTSVLIDSSIFYYYANDERIMLQSESIRYRINNTVERYEKTKYVEDAFEVLKYSGITYQSGEYLGIDRSGYQKGWRDAQYYFNESQEISGNNVEGKYINFYYEFRGPSFAPESAKLFINLIEDNQIIADIHYQLSLSKISVKKIVFRNTSGSSILTWNIEPLKNAKYEHHKRWDVIKYDESL